MTTRELPVYNVDTEEKVLSVSFDAAWGRANTEGILDILDQYGVKANFFLVGFWAEKYPELVAELQARGHEVGNIPQPIRICQSSPTRRFARS